jgi:5-methylcytosine-specific restriction endonuclease McrA
LTPRFSQSGKRGVFGFQERLRAFKQGVKEMNSMQRGVRRVIVFSANYLPLSRIDIRRAVILLVSGKAQDLNYGAGGGWTIRSARADFFVPEYIRLLSGSVERLWKVPAVNRREVFRRDGQVCQYCGSKHYLTLDHVFPRSRGGTHTWDNVVTACSACNQFKSDRTPEEAGMRLSKKLTAPIHPAIAFADQFWHEQQEVLSVP